jgi:hypothetical protein
MAAPHAIANDHLSVPVASAIGPEMPGEMVPPIPAPIPINPNAAGAMYTGTKSPAAAAQIV